MVAVRRLPQTLGRTSDVGSCLHLHPVALRRRLELDSCRKAVEALLAEERTLRSEQAEASPLHGFADELGGLGQQLDEAVGDALLARAPSRALVVVPGLRTTSSGGG